MTSNPTDPPTLWEGPSGPCGRPTKVGTLCPQGRGSASVYAGFKLVWESPACRTHLTAEEREERGVIEQAVEARLSAARAAIEPACWSWPLPTTEDLSAFDTFDDWGASSLKLNDDEADFLRSLRPGPDSVAFEVFHDGRCAICGCTGRLVQDHDHSTGMIRGELCCGCNTAEGFSHLPLFEKYRARNPASILGVRLPYSGFGWVDGVPVDGWEPRYRRERVDLWVDNASARLGL